MAIHTAVPTNIAQPTTSSAVRTPTPELGAHAGEEQGDGEQHDGEHVVGGALEVDADDGRRGLGLGVELLGLGLRGELVLVHGERGRWCGRVGERVGGQPGVERGAELGAEAIAVEVARASLSSAACALTHWKNMAMSTWVWPWARPWARAASMRSALTRPAPLVASPFHRVAW